MPPGASSLIGAVLALGLLIGLAKMGADYIMRKTKLTIDGTVSLDGVTPADPAQLAADAGIPLDTYALARMIMSEAGGLPTSGKIGVGWAARNRAGGGSVAQLLLRAQRAGASGYFGRQDQGRYAATSQDPNPACVDAARLVAEGLAEDPTGGADQWDSPWSYHMDPNTGETAEEKADRVAQARMDAGKELVVLDDVPERKLRFWRAG